MKRENDGPNHPKVRYRSVFSVLHSEAKRHDGGITGLAMALGRNPHSFSNKLNPMCLDSEPTVADLLECLEHLQSRRISTAIALITDCIAVPVETLNDHGTLDVSVTFLRLVKEAGTVCAQIADSLEDGRLDREEKEEAGEVLDALMAATVAMRSVVRG